MRKKRILWLLNQTTLRESEVPLLVKLGFEVFTPKLLSQGKSSRSESVTDEFDRTLSIPATLLKKMNAFNFYEEHWPASLKRQINRYFDTAICDVIWQHPKIMDTVSEAFQGDVFLRVFEVPGDLTIVADFEADPRYAHTFARLKKKRRIWLAPGYPNLLENEPGWIQARAVLLPIGLPQSDYAGQNRWQPQRGDILFVCPEIMTNLSSRQAYTEFKQGFGNFSYVIAGAQTIPIPDDPRIAGSIPSERYDELLGTCQLMFYQSREERHLDYHPLEAVLAGLPLIFMSGGMLEFLAGEKLLGCCDTFDEAREKAARIISGDQAFIAAIVASQTVLLSKFDPQYVETSWRTAFLPLLSRPAPLGRDKRAETSEPRTHLIHVGIWMHETNPAGFNGEGILRLLAMIVRGAESNPAIRFRIACVSWVREAIISYMEKLGVDGERLEFIMVDREPPVLFKIYTGWLARRRRVKPPWWPILASLVIRAKMQVNRLRKRIVSLHGWHGLLLILLFAFIGAPFILLYAFLRLARRISHKAALSFRASRLGRLLQAAYRRIRERALAVARLTYNQIVETELDQLADRASLKKDIACWFFPFPRNEHIAKFATPLIVAVPDIVYLDFPTLFSRDFSSLLLAHPSIEKTVRAADAVITYSDYVKTNHIVKVGLQPAQKVFVIPHAPIDVRPQISTWRAARLPHIRYRAAQIIQEYLRHATGAGNQSIEYSRSLPFGEFDYLFVSSQTRPHKNHLNLLKVYRKLLREKYVNVKLVLTGKLTPEMRDYISQEKLHLDVISLNNLPPRVHAAFYACATLAVIPTLFEGGLPFVFSEALSVGTPVVLSDIAVVRETLPPVLQKQICFDPYDMDAMLERLVWALENRQAVLDAEMDVFNELNKRTWEDVANEYLRVFMSTILIEKTQPVSPTA